MGRRKIEPIFRQRLVIEGDYNGIVTPNIIRNYMRGLSRLLNMTIVFGPRVMNRCEKINPKHKGFEAVMVWAESGCQLYSWELYKFITIDIYCCHPFDAKIANNYTAIFFDMKKSKIRQIK